MPVELSLIKVLRDKLEEQKRTFDQQYIDAQQFKAQTYILDQLAELRAFAAQKERDDSIEKYNRKLHHKDDQIIIPTKQAAITVVLRTTEPSAQEKANSNILFIIATAEQINNLTEIFKAYRRSSVCSADREHFTIVPNHDQSEVQLHFGTCKPQEHIKHFVDTVTALQNNKPHEIPKQLDDVKHLLAIFLNQLLIERDIHKQIHADAQTQKHTSITLRRKR